MNLPLKIDLTPKGKFVERAYIGTEGYVENIEYGLVMTATLDGLDIEYYGENDTYLTDEQIMKVIKMSL